MELVKYTKDNAFQRIKAWYIDENSVILSDLENEKKDRMIHIWSLRLNNKYSKNQVIQIVMRDHKVSQATAYRDYVLSQQLFGELDNVNIAAERMVLAESYWNLYQMALKKGNEDGARKALDSYKSLYNFLDTAQKVDPKKLEASNYILKLPRSTNKLITKMLTAGIVDFNSIGAEDVEFKEILENEEEEEDVE